MDNFDDLIIRLEAMLSKSFSDKKLLIGESFTLWYVLVEGILCDEFEEGDLLRILTRNIKIYQELYKEDADFNFIVGWMVGIAFWYFEPFLEEQDSVRLVKAAYNMARGNSLFKWAIRQPLELAKDEIDNLKLDIELRYDQFFNFGALSKEYFLDILDAR